MTVKFAAEGPFSEPMVTHEGTNPAPARVIMRDLHVVASALASVKPFPAVVERVRSVAADPRSAAADVARLVEGDVGLATDLLRIVNSPASGLTQRCTSLRHAIALLGMQRVSQVIASAAALGFIEGPTVDPALAGHAIATAGVARLIAPMVGLSPDDAFTIGLLHDIGAILVTQDNDPFYVALVEQAAPGEEPSLEDERALMGFDHGALGGEILRQWHMPDPLPLAAALHHRWEDALDAGGAACAMVALVRVAEVLVAATGMIAAPRLVDIDPLFAEPGFSYLGLSRHEIFNVWPALMRTSDDAFVAPTVDRQAPTLSVAPISVRSAPAKLAMWLGLFAFVATALLGALLLVSG